MNVYHTLKAILNREPASAGSHDKQERTAMRFQRVRSWFLGTCIALYVCTFASPAMASAPSDVKKICPDAAIATAPNDIVGRVWGYADLFGPIIAIGALALLILVGSIRKLREKVLPFVIWPLGLLIAFGTVVTILSNLPGTSC